MIQKDRNTIDCVKITCESNISGKVPSTHKRGYTVIPEDKRIELVQMIAREQITIKMAAQRLGINYSTAKNIVKTSKKNIGQIPRLELVKQNSKMSALPIQISPNLKSYVTCVQHHDENHNQLQTTNATPLIESEQLIASIKSKHCPFDFSVYSSLIYYAYLKKINY